MDRVDLRHIPLRPSRFPGLTDKVHWLLFALFLLHWALVWARLWLPQPPFGAARWPDGLLVVLTASTTLCGLARQLPGQNVMLAACIIAATGGAVHTLGVLTGLPFGPFQYTDRIGQQLFYPLPWAVPLIWVVLILNCRGVARLILRPWRQTPNYGFWLLGLSALLVVLLDLSFEAYATQVRGYWSWQPTRIRSNWYGTPWVNFLGWAVSALLLLAFVTPALINKRPGAAAVPPQYHPLAVWALLNLLFLTGAATRSLWSAVVVIGVQLLAVGGFASWGAGKVRAYPSGAAGAGSRVS